MSPGDILNDLTPHARVATAVVPFAFAIVVRLVLGNNRLTQWLMSLTVMWFAANVLLAPYSAGMREDIRNLRTLLP